VDIMAFITNGPSNSPLRDLMPFSQRPFINEQAFFSQNLLWPLSTPGPCLKVSQGRPSKKNKGSPASFKKNSAFLYFCKILSCAYASPKRVQ